MMTSNILFFTISVITPLSPVEMIAPTKDRNFRQFLSSIIAVRIFNPSTRFLDSKPPDFDI